MKTNILKFGFHFLFAITLFFTSCKKDTIAPNISAVVTPITITDINSVAYTDQSITITGTGFNSDITKDTVDFGQYVEHPFNPSDTVYYPSFGLLNQSKATTHVTTNDYIITSATPTQLIIKAVAPDTLSKLLFRKNDFAVSALDIKHRQVRFRVRSNGAFAISKPLTFKNSPILIGGTQELTPGDTAIFTVYGFYSNSICEMKLELSCASLLGCDYFDQYINQNVYYSPVCTCDVWTTVFGCTGGGPFSEVVSYDESQNLGMIRFVMPYNFFNTTYKPNTAGWLAEGNIKARATNKDGKVSKEVVFKTFLHPKH